jgi:hypothetical protein
MKTLLFALIAVAALSTGCKDDTSCDKVVDHTLSILPDELKGQMGDKKTLIARCEEQPVEVRECALAAEDLAALTACGRGDKK